MATVTEICVLLAVLAGIGVHACSLNATSPFTFVTVFMFNLNLMESSKNQLYITSYLPNTSVLVIYNDFKLELFMDGPKSETVTLPPDTELRGTGQYSKTVAFCSNNFITAVSTNQKKHSLDTSLVYPETEWGQQYHVFTPKANGYPKEVAVFSGKESASVTVDLRCGVSFGGRLYGAGEKLTISLNPFQVLYLESNQDCTGSRVVSDKPVGVISGHACAWKNSKCQHSFEQLLPVKHWGVSFIVPPLEFQVLQDSIFVVASQPTRVTYQFGAKSLVVDINANAWTEIPMTQNSPLVISSSQPVQVLYFCNGGKFSDGSVFDPFIMNIVPTDKFCRTYTLEGMEGFSNYALIVAKTRDSKGVQFDGQLSSFKWQPVQGTEYSWAHYTYQKGRGHHNLSHSNATIGVYSVGTVDQNSYGAPAACGLLLCTYEDQEYPPGKSFWGDTSCRRLCQCNSSTATISCVDSQCKAGEECQLVAGKRACIVSNIPTSTRQPSVNTCPENSSYKTCTHVCEHTCAHAQPVPCSPDCQEGCECNPGFMFDGTRCITAANCGCVHHGKPMKPGESRLSADCSEKCTCLPGGGLHFEQAECGTGESCVAQGGVHVCSRPDGTCSLFPDGAFRNFDGLRERIWMDGNYTLVQLGPGAQVPFRVVAHLNLYTCEPRVNFTSFHYKDIRIEVTEHLSTMVNGNEVPLPFHMRNGLSVMGSQDAVVVLHPSGAILRYCTNGKVSLTLPSTFDGELAGLCGNFNGRVDDDLKLQNGSIGDSFKTFYYDWRL